MSESELQVSENGMNSAISSTDSEEAIKASRKKRRAEYHKQYYIKNKDRCDAHLAKYREENWDKVLESGARYREKNITKARARAALYYDENKEKCLAATKKWMATRPGYQRIMGQNRRERIGSGRLSNDIVKKLLALQRGKCACCKRPLGSDFHVDHIKPLSLGGTHTDENVQLLTARCNLQKSAKDPIDFMQQRGFLL